MRENEAGVRVVCREMPALMWFYLFLAYLAAYVIHKLYH